TATGPDRFPPFRLGGSEAGWEAGGGSAASEVVWVYAVTADLDTDQISGLTGVAGEPVRVVSEPDDADPEGRSPGSPRIGAVVGSVDDAVFGQKSLTSLRTDLTSVETVGRAHHKVIASTASAGPVVPLRLATTYPDDATIRTLLAARRAEFTEMLQDFTGRQEWGVKVHVEPLAVAARPACETGREWRWVTAEAWVEKIGQALSAIAVATRRHPSPDPVPGDQAGWLALHGAYLLSAERSAEVGEIVQALPRVRADGPRPRRGACGAPGRRDRPVAAILVRGQSLRAPLGRASNTGGPLSSGQPRKTRDGRRFSVVAWSSTVADSLPSRCR